MILHAIFKSPTARPADETDANTASQSTYNLFTHLWQRLGLPYLRFLTLLKSFSSLHLALLCGCGGDRLQKMNITYTHVPLNIGYKERGHAGLYHFIQWNDSVCTPDYEPTTGAVLCLLANLVAIWLPKADYKKTNIRYCIPHSKVAQTGVSETRKGSPDSSVNVTQRMSNPYNVYHPLPQAP